VSFFTGYKAAGACCYCIVLVAEVMMLSTMLSLVLLFQLNEQQ